MGMMHRQALPIRASLADGDSDASWLPHLGLKSTGSPPRSNLPHGDMPCSLKAPKANHTFLPHIESLNLHLSLLCLALTSPFHPLLEMPVPDCRPSAISWSWYIALRFWSFLILTCRFVVFGFPVS